MIKKNFDKIYFKCLKIAIKGGHSNLFARSNLFAPTVVLIGASHLSKIVRHLDTETWKITNLTRPGWRISANSFAELVTTLESSTVVWNSATVILQLFDNSVYMVGRPGGEKKLPCKDRPSTYHIDGSLVVADKPTVRELVCTVILLLKHLGAARKLFLTPLARYWVASCCDDILHLNNYRLPGYLPRLGDAIHALRDGIRDTLFTKRIDNFRVLCPNRMIGVGQRRGVPSDEEAAASAALWGTDPVLPTSAAYRMMADLIEKDLSNVDARYTNPPKNVNNDKQPCPDLSRKRAEWVRGCSAASARCDLLPPPNKRGRGDAFRHSLQPRGTPVRGKFRGSS